MTSEPVRSWLVLRAVRGLEDASVCRLVRAFGSAAAVLSAPVDELMQRGELSAGVARAIREGLPPPVLKDIDRELKQLDRLRVSILTYLDEAYPARLKQIADPPPVLYVTGALTDADRHAVAVVGSRQATPAGRLFAEELSRDLASAGFTIVSGLARGADGAAHRGALAAGGRTLAVLGCGIDRQYPPEHRALREEIEAHGAVLAELPIGSYPHGYHFPRRNRIISGLSLGVVVTEAALESGSLITARLAADQGREVFAVPGFVNSQTSRGPHALIKQGAKLVERAEDVIEELLPQLDAAFRERLAARPAARTATPPTLGQDEAAVYAVLTTEPIHIDDVIARSGMPAPHVAGLLLSLELKNMIRQLPGQSYLRL